MKYAIVSDIHGNYPALSVVIKDAEQVGVNKYIFVGDYAIGMPYPNQVVDTIRSIKNSYIVRGNHEDYFKKILSQKKSLWTDGQFSAIYWCYNTLTEENREYLMKLPEKLSFTDGETTIYVTHSSKDILGNIEYEEFSSSKIMKKYSNKPYKHDILLNDVSHYLADGLNLEKVNTLSDGIYIFGHTHVQWYAKINGKIFINSGSCGEALDFSKDGAQYTLLNVENDEITIEERHVYYDKEALIKCIKASTLYEKSPVWCKLNISQLITCNERMRFFLNYAEEYANSISDFARPYSPTTWEDAYKSWESISSHNSH